MVDHRFDFLLTNLCFDVGNEADDLLDLFVRKEDCAEHFVFRNLVRARFDHHDRVLRASDRQGQAALLALGHVGIDHIFPVDHAD
ncbi:hypothetical protein SDC9_203325 [bioreactor metagenome]|uniref:Uncharacterized protein n=1 Tax=bioreactor metagenome TaxID=1076179 RepID=A0A645IWC0_9ZZZZ